MAVAERSSAATGSKAWGKLYVDVAVFAGGAGGEFGGGGVEFVELPLREGWVEPGHAGAGGGGEACGDDDAESVKDTAAVRVLAAVVEPENAEGEGTVNGWWAVFGTPIPRTAQADCALVRIRRGRRRARSYARGPWRNGRRRGSSRGNAL